MIAMRMKLSVIDDGEGDLYLLKRRKIEVGEFLSIDC